MNRTEMLSLAHEAEDLIAALRIYDEPGEAEHRAEMAKLPGMPERQARYAGRMLAARARVTEIRAELLEYAKKGGTAAMEVRAYARWAS
jgi:hypothetical protein